MALKIEIGECFGEKMGRVVEQNRICNEFNYGRNSFTASNGFHLFSLSHPDISMGSDGLYVRGFVRSSDNEPFKVPSEEWLDKLRVAVREYNQMPGPSAKTEIIE